jgi:hypothetical protein
MPVTRADAELKLLFARTTGRSSSGLTVSTIEASRPTARASSTVR